MRSTIKTLNLNGIRPDLLGTEVMPETFKQAQNMVTRENRFVRIGGHENVFGTPTEAPRFVIPSVSPSASYWLYIGAIGVYVTDGTTHFDITPVGGIPDSFLWTFTYINDFVIINDPGRTPFYWDGNTGNICLELPGWVSTTRINAIRAYGTYLFGLGVVDAGGVRLNEVMWSDEAVSGQIPQVWTPLTTNDAGFRSLGEGQGAILDGAVLRNRLMIYKTFAAYECVFVGGNVIFAFELVYEDAGVIGTNCVTATKNRHYMMTASDILRHDGTAPPESIADSYVRNFYVDNLDTELAIYCYVVNNSPDDEIWFIFPQKGTSGALMGLVYNTLEEKWGTRLVDYSHAAVGVLNPQTIPFTWDTITDTWETIPWNWNTNVSGASELEVVGAGTTHLVGVDINETFNGIDVLGLAQAGGLHFDEINRLKLVTAVYPRITGLAGEVMQIRVGAQDEVDGGIRWGSYENFTIGVDQHVDADSMGRYIAIEIKKLGGARFRIESIDFEVQYRGMH